MEFPYLMYRSPGPYLYPGIAAKTYGYVQVVDEEEEAAAFERGYFSTLPEAIEDKAAVAPDSPDIHALRTAYEKQFGKRPFMGWSAEALAERIAARND